MVFRLEHRSGFRAEEAVPVESPDVNGAESEAKRAEGIIEIVPTRVSQMM
jgi:hypothetical protein